MNKTNKALMGTLIGIAAVYAGFSFVLTMLNIYDNDGTALRIVICPFEPFNGWTMPDFIHDAYWGLIGLYGSAGVDGEKSLLTILFAVGFALVAAGCLSKPTWDLRGKEDDPQEYLFTHRPMAFFWCLMIPWNILTAAWGLKKIPVIIPIIFIPFMLPFALIIDMFLAVTYIIAWAVMSARISLLASKDRDTYDKDTQYAVCPKCKRNFYQPYVKCRCGLVMSYPTPNKYGLKYHTCNQGHTIPSINTDGARGRLQAVCPYCKGEMFTHEAKPLVISMVGSVGSGKTTLMISAVESLTALAKEKGVVSEIITGGISVAAQRGKANVTPTQAGELDSEYFFLRSRELPEKEIVINDISGVEFQPDRDKVLFEEYYRYNDGIIFTVDPLEIMALHYSQSPTKGSKNTPVAIMESFYHMYTEINGYGPAVKSTVPFAVVLTKMDDPKVRASVDAAGSPAEFLNKYSHKAIADIAENAFKHVRYFKVASIGDNNNAAEPFIWILGENDQELREKLFK
ncbi:MAG: GTPase domain-containing protein [Candidatus Methanoplasma sp.]|jgi:GTPase SAR1 family protein|nr:GTPase domain-containing protein [Candidatus Methanoplasma sp.]